MVKIMNTSIALTVNGKNYEVPSVPGETLSTLLRHRLHLTGTKIACEESECGACTVLVDGEPVLSCMYPADRAHGRNVLTIEGLAAEFGKVGNQEKTGKRTGTERILHPLQQAFIEHGAVQCG